MLVQLLAVLPATALGLLFIPLIYWAQKYRIILFSCALLAGFFWSVFHANLILSQRLPAHLEGKDLQVIGTVVELPHKDHRRTKFRFDINQASLDGEKLSWHGLVQLNYYNKLSKINAGETWALTVRLKRPYGFQNPGGFDYEAWLFREGISATGYVRKHPAPNRLLVSSYSLGALRSFVGGQVQAILQEKENAGIIKALVNGDRSGMTSAHWQVMRQTGTNHLMAISGLHIGLIAGLVFFAVRWLWAYVGIFTAGITVLWLPAQRMAALASMFVATLYAALAGFSIPTQRALIMLLVVMLMIWFKQRVQTSQVLGWALLVILILDPLSVMAPGFWLSFMAVGIIVYVLQGRSQLPRWKKLSMVQIAITVGLAPLLLVFFQQASIISPITNAVAIPFFSFLVVPVSLLGVGLVNIGLEFSGSSLIIFAEQAVSTFWPVLTYCANLLPVAWSTLVPHGWTWLLAMVGVLVFMMPPAWPSRWLGLLFCLPLLTLSPARPEHGKLWLTQLDVGQGLATVIQTRQHTLIYDTGPRFSERFDTGQAVVIPFLQKQGIHFVDMLMISHRDNDHIGGAKSILRLITVNSIVSGEPGKLARALPCIAGSSWQWDGVNFHVLHPQEAIRHANNNNGACVLKITESNGSVLLTADIEVEAEYKLLQTQNDFLPADVLIVPHHGSKTSSHLEFISKVSPGLAIISAGYRNRYRHPSQTVVKRYQKEGIDLLNTAKSGAIRVSFPEKGTNKGGDNRLRVVEYRISNRRFWFTQPASSKAQRLVH